MLKINYKQLILITYLYVIIPIIIFVIGWLKPVLGICATMFLFLALYFAVKDQDSDNYFEIPIVVLIIIAIAAFAWVFSSGVGGFYPQKEDWNWRNAIFRDLINYSWPVVYPATGEGLVYYLTFFLPAALVGKMAGWTAANIALLIWTIIGIIICFLLLCKYFNVKTIKKILAIIIIFIVWREHDIIRGAIAGIFEANWNYEFSPNNTLLEWVTNQAVVPWIVTLIFLNNRNIRNYAFTGLLLFASAPLPFVGLFVLLVTDALYQLKDKSFIKWIKDVFSIQNILSIIVIFPIFGLYFSANMAASGGSGYGGVGLYLEFTSKGWVALMLFWFFNSLFFGILLFKDYKKKYLYWIVVISLMVIPIIQVGDGRDFCMRASIPAVCLMMIFVMEFLFEKIHQTLTVRYMIVVGSLVLFISCFCLDLVNKTSTVIHADTKEVYLAEGVHTLANKLPYAECYGSLMNMYLTDNPYDTVFFSLLCKEKNQDEISADTKMTEEFLKTEGFEIVSGKYTVISANDETGVIEHDVMISNTTIAGKNEIYFTDIGQRLAISEDKNGNKVVVTQNQNTKWGTNNINQYQIFTIRAVDEYYVILWNDTYALTYNNGNLIWKLYDGNITQLWNIE